MDIISPISIALERLFLKARLRLSSRREEVTSCRVLYSDVLTLLLQNPLTRNQRWAMGDRLSWPRFSHALQLGRQLVSGRVTFTTLLSAWSFWLSLNLGVYLASLLLIGILAHSTIKFCSHVLYTAALVWVCLFVSLSVLCVCLYFFFSFLFMFR